MTRKFELPRIAFVFGAIHIERECIRRVGAVSTEAGIRESYAPDVEELTEIEFFNRRRFHMDDARRVMHMYRSDKLRYRIVYADICRNSDWLPVHEDVEVLMDMKSASLCSKRRQMNCRKSFPEVIGFRRPWRLARGNTLEGAGYRRMRRVVHTYACS